MRTVKKYIQDSLPPVMANFALYNRINLENKNNYCRKRVYIGNIKKFLRFKSSNSLYIFTFFTVTFWQFATAPIKTMTAILTDAQSKNLYRIQDLLPPVMANFALCNRTIVNTKNNFCLSLIYICDFFCKNYAFLLCDYIAPHALVTLGDTSRNYAICVTSPRWPR